MTVVWFFSTGALGSLPLAAAGECGCSVMVTGGACVGGTGAVVVGAVALGAATTGAVALGAATGGGVVVVVVVGTGGVVSTAGVVGAAGAAGGCGLGCVWVWWSERED